MKPPPSRGMRHACKACARRHHCHGPSRSRHRAHAKSRHDHEADDRHRGHQQQHWRPRRHAPKHHCRALDNHRLVIRDDPPADQRLPPLRTLVTVAKTRTCHATLRHRTCQRTRRGLRVERQLEGRRRTYGDHGVHTARSRAHKITLRKPIASENMAEYTLTPAGYSTRVT